MTPVFKFLSSLAFYISASGFVFVSASAFSHRQWNWEEQGTDGYITIKNRMAWQVYFTLREAETEKLILTFALKPDENFMFSCTGDENYKNSCENMMIHIRRRHTTYKYRFRISDLGKVYYIGWPWSKHGSPGALRLFSSHTH